MGEGSTAISEIAVTHYYTHRHTRTHKHLHAHTSTYTHAHAHPRAQSAVAFREPGCGTRKEAGLKMF